MKYNEKKINEMIEAMIADYNKLYEGYKNLTLTSQSDYERFHFLEHYLDMIDDGTIIK